MSNYLPWVASGLWVLFFFISAIAAYKSMRAATAQSKAAAALATYMRDERIRELEQR